MVMIAALTSLAKLQQTDWFYKFTWNLFVVHTFLYSFSRFLKFSSFPFSFFSKSVICFSNAFFSSFHCCLIAKKVHKEINIFNIKTQLFLKKNRVYRSFPLVSRVEALEGSCNPTNFITYRIQYWSSHASDALTKMKSTNNLTKTWFKRQKF